jgi:7-cyano-7-deazaguanosine (preQ0) biosynthesis protein QueE
MTTTYGVPAAQLRVAEMFGPTLQGEGPSVGQRALFVRLSGCNLDCTWCDTPYTWDWTRFVEAEQSHAALVPEVLDWVLARHADLVVITGGEPLIQQRRLLPLVAALRAAGRSVEVETNGTIAPSQELAGQVSRFNVSPKLAGSGVPVDRRIRPAALAALRDTSKAIFKFVIAAAGDVEELVALQAQHRLAPVWVMPEGTAPQVVADGLRALVEPALLHGWNLTPRLHVLLWGDQRGR